MSPEKGGRDGFTLVGVLVFCFILVPVCAVLAQSSQNFARGVRDEVDAFREELLGSGISDAVAARAGSDRALFDSLNGKWRTCNLSGYEVAVSVRDHDGKIDLNNAGSELLIAGFEAAGVNHEKAKLLQQFVETSRSNADTPREIMPLLEQLSLKHAPFEHVDELQDILAVLDLATFDLGAVFTVDRGFANIEQSTASEAVREKLRGLVHQGIAFPDNGSFDYVDVLVSLRSQKSGKSLGLVKSYRKVSLLGDVVEIHRARSLASTSLPIAASPEKCSRLLGFQELD